MSVDSKCTLNLLPDQRTFLIMSLRELSRNREANGLIWLKFHQDRQKRKEMNWRTKSELTVRKEDREVIINSQVRVGLVRIHMYLGLVKGDVTVCIESDGYSALWNILYNVHIFVFSVCITHIYYIWFIVTSGLVWKVKVNADGRRVFRRTYKDKNIFSCGDGQLQKRGNPFDFDKQSRKELELFCGQSNHVDFNVYNHTGSRIS